MISEFYIENQTTREIMKFGQDNKEHDLLYKDDGLDWGTAEGEHSTFSFPGQVGVDISITNIHGRDISITGYVYYSLTDDEIQNLSRNEKLSYIYQKIKDKKEKLNALINPDDYVRVVIGDYYISGKPSQSIRYGNTRENNNDVFCQFFIDIFCNNPMFKKVNITKTVLSESKPMFHFPWILPDKGTIMSIRTNYLMLAVDNEGNTQIGGNVILKASGDVENPTVENLVNGQKMTINKTMHDGETIIISTSDDEEKGVVGIVNDVESNYLKYWDFENDWMKFPKGTSLVGYSTDNGSEGLLDVSIELKPEKFGLEEM